MAWRHGTVKGYRFCNQREKGACEGCVEARYQNARLRAKTRLTELFPDLYRALIEEELKRDRLRGVQRGNM